MTAVCKKWSWKKPDVVRRPETESVWQELERGRRWIDRSTNNVTLKPETAILFRCFCQQSTFVPFNNDHYLSLTLTTDILIKTTNIPELSHSLLVIFPEPSAASICPPQWIDLAQLSPHEVYDIGHMIIYGKRTLTHLLKDDVWVWMDSLYLIPTVHWLLVDDFDLVPVDADAISAVHWVSCPAWTPLLFHLPFMFSPLRKFYCSTAGEPLYITMNCLVSVGQQSCGGRGNRIEIE